MKTIHEFENEEISAFLLTSTPKKITTLTPNCMLLSSSLIGSICNFFSFEK